MWFLFSLIFRFTLMVIFLSSPLSPFPVLPSCPNSERYAQNFATLPGRNRWHTAESPSCWPLAPLHQQAVTSWPPGQFKVLRVSGSSWRCQVVWSGRVVVVACREAQQHPWQTSCCKCDHRSFVFTRGAFMWAEGWVYLRSMSCKYNLFCNTQT